MMIIYTDNLNIEALLDFSNQQDDLIKGHQTEMQQVLRNKEQLRTALALEHAQKLAIEQENGKIFQTLRQQLPMMRNYSEANFYAYF